MESNQNYKKVHITLSLSTTMNQLITELCKRSNRKKVQEATLRLEDHLIRFRSISELSCTVSNLDDKDVHHGNTANS